MRSQKSKEAEAADLTESPDEAPLAEERATADSPPAARMPDDEVWSGTPAVYPILQGIGRVFITVGLLVLSFLAYQLWGTNAVTNKTQQALAAQLPKPGEISPSATGSAGRPAAESGTGVAKIRIPEIGVDRVVVEGVSEADLKKGPGHYPGTAFPGETGNVVISGHRTTYGAPFYRLDELKPGDEITLEDASGTYKYRVTEKKVVSPTDLSVVVPSTEPRLTLTTCHPRFSARQRLIVIAALEGPPKGTG